MVQSPDISWRHHHRRLHGLADEYRQQFNRCVPTSTNDTVSHVVRLVFECVSPVGYSQHKNSAMPSWIALPTPRPGGLTGRCPCMSEKWSPREWTSLVAVLSALFSLIRVHLSLDLAFGVIVLYRLLNHGVCLASSEDT